MSDVHFYPYYFLLNFNGSVGFDLKKSTLNFSFMGVEDCLKWSVLYRQRSPYSFKLT